VSIFSQKSAKNRAYDARIFPLKFSKFSSVALKSEFFGLQPSKILKIFACGAKKAESWFRSDKKIRFGSGTEPKN